MCDAFWKKWIMSYFPSLLERPKWLHKRRNTRVGDIVIIKDAKMKRSPWKLRIIAQTCKGIDDRVWRVKVEYANVNSGTRATHWLPRVVHCPSPKHLNIVRNRVP